MKKIIIITLCIWCTTMLHALSLDVVSNAKAVTVYHSGALVSRTSKTTLKQGVHELSFKNVSSKILLNTLKFKNRALTILNKRIIRKLTKEEYSQLEDRQEALTNQLQLLELKYNEPSFVKDVNELKGMMDFYAVKILSIKKELRQVESDIAEAKKLASTELKHDNAAILKVLVSVDQSLSAPLSFQYVVGGIGWSPSYDIIVDSEQKETIEIKYIARVMSQTGEDWENVNISLSSSFPLEDPTSLPKPDAPWVLKKNNGYQNRYNTQNTTKSGNEMQVIDKLEGVEYQEINMPSFLKLRTLEGKFSIKTNSTVFSFPIMTVNLPAKYYYYGFPSLEEESYLVTEVTGWDTIGFVDGMANMTYNNNDLGKVLIQFSEFENVLKLPVGKDNSLFLSRNEIANQKYFKETTISKKKKVTMAYEFAVKNNTKDEVEYRLYDQVPVTQTKFAEVILDNTSGGKVDEELGEVLWKFKLKPGQSTKKELVYTIEMDAKYSYSKKNPMFSPKYKSQKKIYTPRF